MSKYHVNNDGVAGKCAAKSPEYCRFYQSEEDPRHFNSAKDARVGAEEIMRREADNPMGTMRKEKAPIRPMNGADFNLCYGIAQEDGDTFRKGNLTTAVIDVREANKWGANINRDYKFLIIKTDVATANNSTSDGVIDSSKIRGTDDHKEARKMAKAMLKDDKI